MNEDPNHKKIWPGEIPEETKAALIERGYELYKRPPMKPGMFRQTKEAVDDLNAFFETQTDYWVSPEGKRVHWSEVRL